MDATKKPAFVPTADSEFSRRPQIRIWETAPTYVLWEITLRCNLRCAHCATGGGRKRSAELTTPEALTVCDDLAALNTQAVCLMGGEPFLRKDWPVLLERLQTHRIASGVFTNGWLLSDKKADALLAHGVCQVGLSLDAADAAIHDRNRNVAGAHARALVAIRRVAERPFAYKTVVTSVNKTNLDQLGALRDLLLEHGPGFTWTLNITTCHDPRRFDPALLADRRDFERVAAFISANRPQTAGRLDICAADDIGYHSTVFANLRAEPFTGCRAGLDTLGIESHGGIKGCLVLPAVFRQGNLRQTPLVDLWRDPQRFALNRGFSVERLAGGCRGCDRGATCRAGCSDLAYSYTGSPYHHPFCLYRKERG